jgi:hypothetical protein
VNLEASEDIDPLWETLSSRGTNPASISSEWHHLGFDVADRDQTCVLSGCEYTPEEMAHARLHWGSHVNDSGLLDNLQAALGFKTYSDKRVPELGPYYLYEIFKIEVQE